MMHRVTAFESNFNNLGLIQILHYSCHECWFLYKQSSPKQAEGDLNNTTHIKITQSYYRHAMSTMTWQSLHVVDVWHRTGTISWQPLSCGWLTGHMLLNPIMVSTLYFYQKKAKLCYKSCLNINLLCKHSLVRQECCAISNGKPSDL